MKQSLFKNIIHSTVLCSSLAFALSGCVRTRALKTDDKAQASNKVSVNQNSETEELVNAGEQLIAAHTFHLADKVFEMALSKDPQNKKAQFYRAFLQRFMVFRGVLSRIKPAVEKYGDINAFEKSIKSSPDSPLKDFLMKPAQGATEIKSEVDLQNLLVDYRLALKEFRNFVRDNPTLELNLRINPQTFKEKFEENLKNSCTFTTEKSELENSVEGKFSTVCNFSNAATVKVNSADLLVLKQEAAIEQLYAALYTSYSLEGYADVIKDNADKKLSSQAYYKLLEEKVSLKLLPQQGLSEIIDLGSDFVVAAKEVIRRQSELCPNKSSAVYSRKGMLVENSLCVENSEQAAKSLAMIEQAFKGVFAMPIETTSTISSSDPGQPPIVSVTTTYYNVNLVSFLTNPPKDLIQLFPATWSEDGSKILSYKDNTLGGLFPDGDFDKSMGLRGTKEIPTQTVEQK